METEKYIPWKVPGMELSKDIMLVNMHGDYDLLTLTFSVVDKDKTYELDVIFDSHVAFRLSEEGDRLLMLSRMDTVDLRTNVIFEVLNSEYNQWLNYERGFSESYLHLVFLTGIEIIDVLCTTAPSFVTREL